MATYKTPQRARKMKLLAGLLLCLLPFLASCGVSVSLSSLPQGWKRVYCSPHRGSGLP